MVERKHEVEVEISEDGHRASERYRPSDTWLKWWLLPSTASPLDIFFRYLVMSAAVSGMDAAMLNRGRDPVDASSAGRGKHITTEEACHICLR